MGRRGRRDVGAVCRIVCVYRVVIRLWMAG